MLINNFALHKRVCGDFNLKWYQCWIKDKRLWVPKLEDIHAFLNDTSVEMEQYYSEIFDCDDFATCVLCECRKWVAERQFKYSAPWTLMSVSGTLCRGMVMSHTWNLCLTEDGFYHLESMMGADRLWKHNPEENKIFLAHT